MNITFLECTIRKKEKMFFICYDTWNWLYSYSCSLKKTHTKLNRKADIIIIFYYYYFITFKGDI
jgi:hypothetical protein